MSSSRAKGLVSTFLFPPLLSTVVSSVSFPTVAPQNLLTDPLPTYPTCGMKWGTIIEKLTLQGSAPSYVT